VIGTVVCDFGKPLIFRRKVQDLTFNPKAHHPWVNREIWDAIVCDPPYGVRAGAKKIIHKTDALPLFKK
jgi:tRNA G10  N-methylase Trm11